MEERITAMTASGILAATHPTGVLLRAGCSPLSTVAIRLALLRPTPNPYGLPKDLAEAIDALGVEPSAPGVTCDAKLAAAVKAISRDETARATCADGVGMSELRDAVLAYLR